MFPPDSTCVLPFCIVETNDRTHIVCFLLVGCLLLLLSLSLSLFIFNVYPENLPGFSRTFRACRHTQNCVSTLVHGGFLSCVSFRVYEAYQSYAMVPLSIPTSIPSYTSHLSCSPLLPRAMFVHLLGILRVIRKFS